MTGKSRWGALKGDDGHDTANSINVEYYLLSFLELFYLQLFISVFNILGSDTVHFRLHIILFISLILLLTKNFKTSGDVCNRFVCHWIILQKIFPL